MTEMAHIDDNALVAHVELGSPVDATHLGSCGDCCSRLETVKRLNTSLENLLIPSGAEKDRVITAVLADVELQSTRSPFSGQLRGASSVLLRPLLPIGIAASFALVASLSIMSARDNPDQAAQDASSSTTTGQSTATSTSLTNISPGPQGTDKVGGAIIEPGGPQAPGASTQMTKSPDTNRNTTSTPTTAPYAPDHGYWIIRNDGSIDAIGTAPALNGGNTAIVAAAGRPNGDGLWQLSANGTVHALGNARRYGNASPVGSPAVGIMSSPSGNGYVIVQKDGTLTKFGDATLPPRGITFSGEVIKSSGRIDRGNYYFVTSTNRVYNYTPAGDVFAKSYPTSDPIVAVVADGDGLGYWVVTRTGKTFTSNAAEKPALTLLSDEFIVDARTYGNGYIALTSKGRLISTASIGIEPFIANQQHVLAVVVQK